MYCQNTSIFWCISIYAFRLETLGKRCCRESLPSHGILPPASRMLQPSPGHGGLPWLLVPAGTFPSCCCTALKRDESTSEKRGANPEPACMFSHPQSCGGKRGNVTQKASQKSFKCIWSSWPILEKGNLKNWELSSCPAGFVFTAKTQINSAAEIAILCPRPSQRKRWACFCIQETKHLRRRVGAGEFQTGGKLTASKPQRIISIFFFFFIWDCVCQSEYFYKRQIDYGSNVASLPLQNQLSTCCQASCWQHSACRALSVVYHEMMPG